MDINLILYLGRYTLETALMIAAPMLGICMIVGITVTLFQAVTSIRDMTLTIVPKLLAMSLASLIFGNWMMQNIMKFTVEIFNIIKSYGYH